jgi:uncharacterized protein
MVAIISPTWSPPLKIAVNMITEVPEEVSFSERIEDLNQIDADRRTRDFLFPPFLNVDLAYYRSGRELFFNGMLHGNIQGCCGRCLESYTFRIEKGFEAILVPEPLPTKKRELTRDELGVSFYSGEEINLSPFIREQVFLALPMRPLCDESCRGICSRCGVNLNHGSCSCVPIPGDSRLAFFRNLRVDR